MSTHTLQVDDAAIQAAARDAERLAPKDGRTMVDIFAERSARFADKRTEAEAWQRFTDTGTLPTDDNAREIVLRKLVGEGDLQQGRKIAQSLTNRTARENALKVVEQHGPSRRPTPEQVAERQAKADKEARDRKLTEEVAKDVAGWSKALGEGAATDTNGERYARVGEDILRSLIAQPSRLERIEKAIGRDEALGNAMLQAKRSFLDRVQIEAEFAKRWPSYASARAQLSEAQKENQR